jgi:hypothetical protein
MSAGEILVGVVLGLIVNEFCDVSPWLARRLVRLSARMRYGSPDRRDMRAEEQQAIIDLRPGKLLKLATAAWFAVSAAGSWAHVSFRRRLLLHRFAKHHRRLRRGRRRMLRVASKKFQTSEGRIEVQDILGIREANERFQEFVGRTEQLYLQMREATRRRG